MEQIYQWSEYRKNLLVRFVVSYNTVVKDDWLERTRAINLSVYQAPETFNRQFWYQDKNSFNISRF